MEENIAAISGATGLIGSQLSKRLLESGYKIKVLTRNVSHAASILTKDPGFFYINLPDNSFEERIVSELEGCNCLVNLAGASIAGRRWNNEYKKLLYDSRINTTRTLVKIIKKLDKKPSVFINASASGYYGTDSRGESDEYSESGDDFLSLLVKDWEDEALKARNLGVRTVILRIGIVLSKRGGALEKIINPFKFFVGGHLGSGNQWMPWIHIDDLISMFLFALKNPNFEGVYNAVSPNSITNKQFSKSLGKTLKKPSLFPVPCIILKLITGKFSKYLLEGKKIIPKRTLESGFTFQYPEIDYALHNILIE